MLIFFSLIGNILPVIPLLFIFKHFFHKLEGTKVIGGFFKWWFGSVSRRSRVVDKWGFWGLVLFVAIPLPVTGAWTGTVAATLFNFEMKKGFIAISLGVIIAGIIVTLASLGIGSFWR
ncbi:MAG: small multi-drug export protein [Candidatus Omnitrophota bacterium]